MYHLVAWIASKVLPRTERWRGTDVTVTVKDGWLRLAWSCPGNKSHAVNLKHYNPVELVRNLTIDWRKIECLDDLNPAEKKETYKAAGFTIIEDDE